MEQCSYLTVIPSIGTVIAAFIYPRLSDIIGRKQTLLSITIPYTLSWILIALSTNIYSFYVARFIGGLGDACIFSTLPSYIGEISTPKVRGFWGNCIVCYGLLGQVYVNSVGGYLNISTTALISLINIGIFLLTFIFAPETPYYYIMKQRKEDARIALQKLRRIDNVDDELATIESAVKRQMSESCKWNELIAVKGNRRAIIAGVFLRSVPHLAGVAVFMMYTQYIFQQAGGNLSAINSSIVFSVAMVLLSVTASGVIARLGRRLPLILSLTGSCAALGMLAVYFYVLQKTSVDLTNFKWVPLLCMLIYVVFFAMGALTVPTLMLSELFSASIKAKGLCILIIVFSVWVSVTSKLFHLLDTTLGLFAPFAFFSICCLCNIFIAFKIVPETKGKTLEEIQQYLRR